MSKEIITQFEWSWKCLGCFWLAKLESYTVVFHRYRSFLEIIHHPWRFNPQQKGEIRQQRWCLVGNNVEPMPVPGTQLTEGLSICWLSLKPSLATLQNTNKDHDIISYHIHTSLYLQTPRKSATTKEHIPSKNGLSQDAEIPKSLSLVLLDWVQL